MKRNLFYEPVNTNQWNIFEEVEGIGHQEYFLATKATKPNDYLLLHVGQQDEKYAPGIYAIAKVLTYPNTYLGNKEDYCYNKLSVNTEIIKYSTTLLMSFTDYKKYDKSYRRVHIIKEEYIEELLKLFELK